MNPTFANQPRWLWESVALFENGELVDPRTIPYLAQGRFPTLGQLDADPNASRQVYEVGYLIGEFVVARAGRAGLLRLIRANGDVTALGFAESRAPSNRSGRPSCARATSVRGIDTRGARPIDSPFVRRAVSSAVEHRSYTPGVAGSNPAPPTTHKTTLAGW